MNKIKKTIFIFIPSLLFLLIINSVSGLIAKNTYVRLNMVTKKTEKDTIGYYAPNQKRTIVFPGLKPYQVTINNLGLRTVGEDPQSIENTNNKQRILCVGDSMTFGLFNNDEDSYPYQLQKIINDNNTNIEIFNAGIGSTTIRDHLYYIKEKGLALNPDIVITNFYGNDLFELDREKPYYKEILEWESPSFNRLFKRTKFMRAFLKFYVFNKYNYWLSKTDDEKLRDILENKRTDIEDLLYASQNKHAELTIREPYNPRLEKLWKKYFAEVDKAATFLESKKIKLIFLINPEILSVFEQTEGNHEEILIDYLNERGIPYINLIPQWKKLKDNIIEYYNNAPRDFHLSRKGNQFLA
ncbi:hypothetical protein MNBD_BACTEROID05-538, partial [hydrothermal vent metagenome]